MNAKSAQFSARGGDRGNGRASASFDIPDTSTGLLRDLQKGADAARWPDFANRYDPVVRRFLAIVARTHQLVDPADCDDLVQETMVELWKLFPRRTYDRSRNRFRDFLFGVVRKVATRRTSDDLRRITRETETAAGAEQATDSDPAAEALRSEAEELWRLVVDGVFAEGRWSDKAKAVFVRTEHGEDIEKVAAEYGMTPNSVYQLRHRASRRVEAALRRLVRDGAARRAGSPNPTT